MSETAAVNASDATSRRNPAREVKVTLPLAPRMWAWLMKEERREALGGQAAEETAEQQEDGARVSGKEVAQTPEQALSSFGQARLQRLLLAFPYHKRCLRVDFVVRVRLNVR